MGSTRSSRRNTRCHTPVTTLHAHVSDMTIPAAFSSSPTSFATPRRDPSPFEPRATPRGDFERRGPSPPPPRPQPASAVEDRRLRGSRRRAEVSPQRRQDGEGRRRPTPRASVRVLSELAPKKRLLFPSTDDGLGRLHEATLEGDGLGVADVSSEEGEGRVREVHGAESRQDGEHGDADDAHPRDRLGDGEYAEETRGGGRGVSALECLIAETTKGPEEEEVDRRRRRGGSRGSSAEGSGEESVKVDEGEDAEEEGDHATQVEPPVRPEETLVHQAEDLVRHEEEKAGGEGERAGEEGGDEGSISWCTPCTADASGTDGRPRKAPTTNTSREARRRSSPRRVRRASMAARRRGEGVGRRRSKNDGGERVVAPVFEVDRI